ncbi:MAG: hypothetical protein Q8Q89_02430 [bacterium]|nr:hypothetical protein [bacterium]
MDEQGLINLYTNNKKSSSEIAKVFKCSEHKINYWINKYGIQKRTLSDSMYAKYNPHGDPFLVRKPTTLKEANLLGLGLGLYWGEGNKKNKNSIRLGNTDPRIIKKFIEFLIKIFGIKKDKLRFGLQIFSDISEGEVIRFWLNELKDFSINSNQFFKVTVTPSRSLGSYREKSKFGVLTVHFCNVKLKNILDNMLPL